MVRQAKPTCHRPLLTHILSADAVPKVKLQAAPPGKASSKSLSKRDSIPVPTTIVTKVDGEPSCGEVPHTDAYNKRTMDAEPDVVEEKGDVPGKSFRVLGTVQRAIDRVRLANFFFEQILAIRLFRTEIFDRKGFPDSSGWRVRSYGLR